MCTALGVALSVGVTTAVVGITESIVGGVIQKNRAQAQANMAAKQAEAYNKLAQDTEQQGQWEKRELALEAKAKKGAMLADAASRGTLIGTGSNLTMEEDLAQTADFDQKMKDYDIASRKYQYQMQEYNSLMSKSFYEQEVKSTNLSMIGGSVKGVLNGITTGGSVYGSLKSTE